MGISGVASVAGVSLPFLPALLVRPLVAFFTPLSVAGFWGLEASSASCKDVIIHYVMCVVQLCTRLLSTTFDNVLMLPIAANCSKNCSALKMFPTVP